MTWILYLTFLLSSLIWKSRLVTTENKTEISLQEEHLSPSPGWRAVWCAWTARQAFSEPSQHAYKKTMWVCNSNSLRLISVAQFQCSYLYWFFSNNCGRTLPSLLLQSSGGTVIKDYFNERNKGIRSIEGWNILDLFYSVSRQWIELPWEKKISLQEEVKARKIIK